MIQITIYDTQTEQEILIMPRHATMRKVPNEDYCFSVRLYGLNQFEINRLKKLAKRINKNRK